MTTWKPIPDYVGLYEASDEGAVRHSKFDRLLKQHPDKDGYLQVRLCKNNKARTVRVSRVVLLAFVGAPAHKQEALHKDHDRKNNSLQNLEWGSRLENEQQKTLAGRRPRTAKLTAEQVSEIRALRSAGATLKSIASTFDTHFSNVSLICRGATWA
jgi:hypothetical protein